MSDAEVHLERTEDRALWDELVRTAGEGTAFHDWDWLDLQSDVLRMVVERLLIVRDGVPVGVFPVPHAHRAASRAPAIPFPFLGPVCAPADLPPAIRALSRWQWRHGVPVVRFELAPGAEGAPPGSAVSWHEDSTVVVDLSHGSAELLRSGYTAMRKRSVRRAEAAGASVRPSAPGEVEQLLPLVLDEAYGGRGVPSPYPRDVGELVARWARGREDVYLGTALVDEEPAGVFVALGGHPVALSWAGGCLRRFREAGPNVLLYEDQLLWSLRTGHSAMDLVGRVDEGILRFKLAFGGKTVPYRTAESLLGPPAGWRALRAGRSFARRALQRQRTVGD